MGRNVVINNFGKFTKRKRNKKGDYSVYLNNIGILFHYEEKKILADCSAQPCCGRHP